MMHMYRPDYRPRLKPTYRHSLQALRFSVLAFCTIAQLVLLGAFDAVDVQLSYVQTPLVDLPVAEEPEPVTPVSGTSNSLARWTNASPCSCGGAEQPDGTWFCYAVACGEVNLNFIHAWSIGGSTGDISELYRITSDGMLIFVGN